MFLLFFVQNLFIISVFLAGDLLGEFLEAAADARVSAGNDVAVDAEHTAAQALTITATTAQARAGVAIAPAIGDIGAVAARSAGGDEERRQARDGLDAQRADPAVRWLADQDAAGAVRKGRRVENDHHAVAVVVAAVHPVEAVVPQALNVAVLRGCAVGRAGARRRAGVVRHGIRIAHVLHAGVVAAAVADDCLAVPVGVLDDVEQPDGKGHQKVALPHGRTEGVDVASRGAARDVVFWRRSSVALVVAAAAVVASDVDHIAFALAVPAVHVRGRDGEAVRCGVRDLDFQAVSDLRQLVPELRDGDELARRAVLAHDHAAPRQLGVERGAIVADAAHVSDGVGKARRVVCAAQERCTCAVPRYAVNRDRSDGDRLCRGLRNAALGVDDRNGRIIGCERSRGRERVGWARQRRAVGIGRHDHHARRVKVFALHVVCLCRRRHDGDSSQLDADSGADDAVSRCVVRGDACRELLRCYGVPSQVKQNRSVAELDFVVGHAAPPQPMVTVLPPCGLSV